MQKQQLQNLSIEVLDLISMISKFTLVKMLFASQSVGSTYDYFERSEFLNAKIYNFRQS